MIDWSETQRAVRDMVQKFVEAEIKPKVEELEHGDTPPYDVLRKLYKTFGMDEMARQRFHHQIARDKKAEEARGRGEQPPPAGEKKARARRRRLRRDADHPDHRDLQALPTTPRACCRSGSGSATSSR